MSQNTDPNQDQTDTGKPSLVAPALSATGSGSYSLMPDVKLPARKVADKPIPGGVSVVETDFTKEGYVGQNLVNVRGEIVRPQYSTDEAYSELARMSLPERRNFQNALYSVGAYGKSKPSQTGFKDSDLSAMRQVLRTANVEGVTIDVAVGLMATKYGGTSTGSGSGSGTRIRTTPKQDVSAVFRQVSSQLLGRRLSDVEINKFVKSYNRMETVEGMGGAIAPNVSVAAEQFVRTGAPEESTAMGALTLTNIIDNAIKGLG